MKSVVDDSFCIDELLDKVERKYLKNMKKRNKIPKNYNGTFERRQNEDKYRRNY